MWQNPTRGKATAEGQANRQLKYRQTDRHASKLTGAMMTLSSGYGVFSAAVRSCSVQVAAEIVLLNSLHVYALVMCRATSHVTL